MLCTVRTLTRDFGTHRLKSAMREAAHWEKIYRTKAPDAVSWYRPHLESSLDLIDRAAGGSSSASIIDVGGGASTLVDDLLARGYRFLTVLDISPAALAVAKNRLGRAAEKVLWLAANVTEASLAAHEYDVWHDRAVFHFLTAQKDRDAYVRQAIHAVKRGGSVILGTFGPEGPTKCSGLDVQRYNAQSLHQQFGEHFSLVESAMELHETPFGTTQQFLYCWFKAK
jgi:SAM-dependent methyltransferase